MQEASEIAQITGADPAFIRDKVGVERRYILADGETGVSLAATACRKLFENSLVRLVDIGILIFVSQTPDRRIPTNSAPLQHLLGLPTTVAGFDLAMGCSGYVHALVMAEALLSALQRDHALVVTCDPYSRIIAPSDKATNTVFGDAATASLLSRQGRGGQLGWTDFGTDGEGASSLEIRAGGAARPLVGVIQPEPPTLEADDLRLRMDGREVFNFVQSRIPVSIENCLKNNSLSRESVDFYALHQGSKYMLDALVRRSNIPFEKIVFNMDKYGNTVSSSIPLLLEGLVQSDNRTGKTVLISGFGVGLSWATSVLRF